MEQKMEDNSSNPNIEWKKPGFGSSEKLSLKVNTKEAVLYDAKKKNGLQKSNPLTPADLPAGLKKIRQKIKMSLTKTKRIETIPFSFLRKVCRKPILCLMP